MGSLSVLLIFVTNKSTFVYVHVHIGIPMMAQPEGSVNSGSVPVHEKLLLI